MSPPLALGQAVHDVIEVLSTLPQVDRFKAPLLEEFERAWEKVTGERGGFKNRDEEENYKTRGREMINRIVQNPGILLNKAVKIRNKDNRPGFELPHYTISPQDNIELCGKIDWVEYIEADNSIHIVDFKTGRHEEDGESLQLLIYYLLARNLQSRNVSSASYWYIDRENTPTIVKLPSEEEAKDRVLEIAKRITLARQLNLISCPKGGCHACLPYEAILRGEGKWVGVSDTRQDVFVLV